MGKSSELIHLLQRRCPENYRIRKTTNSSHISDAKAILGAGFHFNSDWVDLPKEDSGRYWLGCQVTSEMGQTFEPRQLLRQFSSFSEKISKVDSSRYEFKKTSKGWRISGPCGEIPESKFNVWELEAKLTLSQSDLDSILNLLHAYVPSGKTVSLQADSHVAGDCWVGLVASYDQTRIPFVPVSADIGCGMSLVPVVSGTQQLNLNSIQLERLQAQVCYRTRKILARGKVANQGGVTQFPLMETLSFLGYQDSLGEWVNQFRQLLDQLQISIPKTPIQLNLPGLSQDQLQTLQFILGFGMTLGSSGNHFLELNSDPEGFLYMVVHSGSRGLGALIYKKISDLCHMILGENAVATGWLAQLYNQAFSVLNRFAFLNRIGCAVAVLKDLGYCWNGETLRKTLLEQNPLFSGIPEPKISQLLQGVTHNGIKCFINPEAHQKIFVLSKGAIAVSAQASCSLVALRAGEGVYLMTFLDPQAKWIEQDLRDLDSVQDYEMITELDQTDILLMGHGAGRSGSATQTWKQSQYQGMLEYYHRHGIWANLSPNVLGDNPEVAYKPVEEIIPYLPLAQAHSSAILKTRVNHKEGIDYRPGFKNKFAEFVIQGWESFTPQVKLMCDLVLITRELTKALGEEWFQAALAEQEQLYLAQL